MHKSLKLPNKAHNLENKNPILCQIEFDKSA